MHTVNIFEAKSTLSRLIARLVPLDIAQETARLGVATGRFEVPEDIDAGNVEIARLFFNGDTV
jgi:antitoxin (DNA-binding transcriptional repressor) of toxin-antitoxin stability system